MKKILIIAAILPLLSCSKQANSFILKGEISGAESGELINLSYPILKDGVWYQRNLQTEVVDGRFVFEGDVEDITLAYLSFENMDLVDIFIEPTKMKITMERELPYAYSMRGLSIQQENTEYRAFLEDAPQLLHEKGRAVQKLNEEWISAYQAQSKSADSLMRRFYEAVQEYKTERVRDDDLRIKFLAEHSDYVIAPSLLYMSIPQQLEDNTLQSIYDEFPNSNKNSLMGQVAKAKIDISSVDTGGKVGDNAFRFERFDIDGDVVKLTDYLSDSGYVLLDFWASWCTPCIKQVPNVKRAHEKYLAKGLRIIGVSSDDDMQAWRTAVEKHSMSYCPQVLSVEPSSDEDEQLFRELVDVAMCYEVESIPCFILIDGAGKIVARWQHFSNETFTYLDSLFER